MSANKYAVEVRDAASHCQDHLVTACPRAITHHRHPLAAARDGASSRSRIRFSAGNILTALMCFPILKDWLAARESSEHSLMVTFAGARHIPDASAFRARRETQLGNEHCMVGVAQLVRAPDCGSGGRGFESPHSPHISAAAASDTQCIRGFFCCPAHRLPGAATPEGGTTWPAT